MIKGAEKAGKLWQPVKLDLNDENHANHGNCQKTMENPGERPAMGPGFLHTHYFNRFGCMATGNMIRELKLQLIIEFL